MKGYYDCSVTLSALLFLSSVNGATSANASAPGDDPEKLCEEYGLALAKKIPVAQGRLLPGRDIEVRKGYVIKVAYFDPIDRTQDDTGNFVAILTKGLEPLETAEISLVCLNKHIHPSHCNKPGEIEFLSHLGKPLNIKFHLLKEPETGQLTKTSWRSTAALSLGISDGTADEDQSPDKPAAGHLPAKCLAAGDIKGGGSNEDLYFKFSKCLTPASDDIYFKYDLYFNRDNGDGTVTPYDLDPQIINHGH